MPDGTATTTKKPYVVTLPHGMKLEVDLESPHRTSLRILFEDGNGVKFEYSGEKGAKGTVDAIGTVLLTNKDGKTKRWEPDPSSAGARSTSTEAYLETGEH